ncbi:putative mitochondrial protein, partial [Mucuna pruriens]
MENECWHKAIETKLLLLEENQTWDIVSCPPSIKPLGAIAMMTIVHTLLALAASQSWPLHQMAFTTKFPKGCTHLPLILFQTKTLFIWIEIGPKSMYDPSLFLQRTPKGIVVLFVYVDDIVTNVAFHFHMKKLGHLTYFFGLEQAEILDDPILYRKLVGSLIYVTITHLDISFVVHNVSKFMQSPQYFHFSVVQQIIRYLLSSSTCGLFFPTYSSLNLQSLDSLKHNQLHCMLTTLVLYKLQQIQNTLKLIVTRSEKRMIIESSAYHIQITDISLKVKSGVLDEVILVETKGVLAR